MCISIPVIYLSIFTSKKIYNNFCVSFVSPCRLEYVIQNHVMDGVSA